MAESSVVNTETELGGGGMRYESCRRMNMWPDFLFCYRR